MANYTDKPKKHASRDIAVDKLDFTPNRINPPRSRIK